MLAEGEGASLQHYANSNQPARKSLSPSWVSGASYLQGFLLAGGGGRREALTSGPRWPRIVSWSLVSPRMETEHPGCSPSREAFGLS